MNKYISWLALFASFFLASLSYFKMTGSILHSKDYALVILPYVILLCLFLTLNLFKLRLSLNITSITTLVFTILFYYSSSHHSSTSGLIFLFAPGYTIVLSLVVLAFSVIYDLAKRDTAENKDNSRVFTKRVRIRQLLLTVVSIALILFGFSRLDLSGIPIHTTPREEMSLEIKQAISSFNSTFLTRKLIYEDFAAINSISRMECRPGSGSELLLALSNGIVFLNESYQVTHKIKLDERKNFSTLEPLYLDNSHSCGFIAYGYPEGVYLFDFEGREIWKSVAQDDGTGVIRGVRFGDIDGDGKPEFAIYHKFDQGISLVGGDGQTRWKYPKNWLGHFEIEDIQGNGKAEIVISNSNSAQGVTGFTFLDSIGTVEKKIKIDMKSDEFAIIKWPRRDGKPNILLTEDAKIRIIDLDGNTIMQFDAPGCTAWGEVRALPVKFSKDVPEYLAVMKRLSPKLSVLYVYDTNNKLVYLKAEVGENNSVNTIAAVSTQEAGTEKLLVGESAPNFRAQVAEYTLAR